MLNSAKQIMTGVTRLKLPPKSPIGRPRTREPKLVMIRALSAQNPIVFGDICQTAICPEAAAGARNRLCLSRYPAKSPIVNFN